MLERDILTKPCPQRWQDLSVKELQALNVVLCFDDRIFEIVLEDLQLRVGAGDWKPLHLLCLDTKDTPEHAKIGGSLALELCQAVRPMMRRLKSNEEDETDVRERVRRRSTRSQTSTTGSWPQSTRSKPSTRCICSTRSCISSTTRRQHSTVCLRTDDYSLSLFLASRCRGWRRHYRVLRLSPS